MRVPENEEMKKIKGMSRKERDTLKELEKESLKVIVLEANLRDKKIDLLRSGKSEEKLEENDQFL